ncbi:MAG: glycosyltransferase family 39 protein [bacterium]|nr:glycosyltransferase family 39 protein [bacterium]MDW8163786.1 glycosyltransferase family 39 protein [Candidatus Omnitrophota bacterium]
MERTFERKNLIYFLIIGFLLRLIFVLTLKNQLYFDDEYEYFKIVKNFIDGKGLIIGENLKSFRPPLYPFFLSILTILKINLIGIRILQTIISTITIYLIYLIAKETFNEKIGIWSGWVSAFYPFFIFYNGFLLTETLFVFFVVLSMFYLIKTVGKNGIVSFKAGIFMGVAGLTRPTFQLFLPIVILHIMFFKENLRVKFMKIFFLLCGFCLILSPWIIRNYKIFRKFIPGTTMGGWVFWEGNNPFSEGGPCAYFPKGILEMDEVERDKLLYKMTVEVIRKNPQRFLYLLKNKFKRFWNVIPNASEFREKILYRLISIFSFGILLHFFILGFFLSLKNKKAQFFHSLIILFTLFHMVFLASIRYRLPIEPFYIIFSLFALSQLTKLTSYSLSRSYK